MEKRVPALTEWQGGLGSVSLPEALAAAADGPTRRPVIDPLVAREETSLLQSQPRDGKTWTMLAGGLAVATGEQFAGRFATEQTNVLYLTNEDGERAVVNRLEMLMRGMEIKRAPEGFRLHVGRGTWLDDPGCQQRVIDEIRSFEIGLFIPEPLRSVTGCVDKGPADLQPFARFLRRLIGETGCAVWCGHHETKPNGFQDERRAAQRSSGGGLFSAMDAPISIERVDDKQSRFVPDGFKHCETPAPFIVERVISEGAVYLCVVDAPEGQTGADIALLEEVRQFLRTHPHSSGRQVERAIKKQADRVRAALDTLKATGEARYIPKGRSHLWTLK